MYSVMIVDDEMLVRMGLKAMVNWESLGFQIVGEAGSGQAAYEKFLVEKPDLVITDIEMPRGDGFWLTEKIKAEYPDTQIIFLTCHDEFDYARKALKLQVADYLLKAEMEEEDVSSILLKKKAVLDKRRNKKEAVRETREQHDDRLLGLLMDVKYPIEDVYILLDQLEIGYINKKNCFAIFDFSGDLIIEKYTAERAANIIMVCLELIGSKLAEQQTQFFFKRVGKSVVFFLMDEWLTDLKMQKIIVQIQESVRRYFGISTKAACTLPANQIAENRKHILWIYEAANYLFYCSGDEILTMDTFTVPDELTGQPDKDISMKMVTYLLAGNPEQALTEGLSFCEYMKRVNKNTFDFKLSMTHLMADIAEELQCYLPSMDETDEYMRLMMQEENLAQVTSRLKEFLDCLEARMMETRVENYEILIRQAQLYIEEHYQEKITLDEVAGAIGISRFYFSTLFKQTAGINFSAYLNGVRIKKAKELLKNPVVTVGQVFEQVGFHDSQYFSKTFKKYTGMTVKEYRESLMIQT